MSERERVNRQAQGDHPLILVSVGTDKHPFDRLMGWLETWHGQLASPVQLVVQHGHGRAPQLTGATPFLGHDDLQKLMSEATLVVSHGGPATITEARRTGHLPIVVPRDPTYGEHVDNHQQLFSRRLAAAEMVRLCESEDALVAALTAGLTEPDTFLLAPGSTGESTRLAAVARVGELIEGLIDARAQRRNGKARG